jgi:hypothetical protein
MTRAEQKAEAKRLRGLYKGYREIARELDVSHTTVIKWLGERPRCAECETVLLDASPDGLCGFCRAETALALTEPAPARTFAIFRLRDRGYPAEAVVRAVSIAKRSAPTVEEILAVLLPSSLTEPESDRSVHV